MRPPARVPERLGFTAADRAESIRRIGGIAKLFVDAGMIVLCAFISPFRAERRLVREVLQDDERVEIFFDVPLVESMRSDPKGLYSKAKGGLKRTSPAWIHSARHRKTRDSSRYEAASPEQLAWLCGR